MTHHARGLAWQAQWTHLARLTGMHGFLYNEPNGSTMDYREEA